MQSSEIYIDIMTSTIIYKMRSHQLLIIDFNIMCKFVHVKNKTICQKKLISLY